MGVVDLLNVKFFNWDSEFTIEKIEIQDLHLSELLTSIYAHEQQIIKFIDNFARVQTSLNFCETLSNKNVVIKIESIEKLKSHTKKVCDFLSSYFNHNGPVTAHVFISPKNGISFPWHTDPDAVIIYVVSGIKKIQFKDCNGEFTITIPVGNCVIIPKNFIHKACNDDESVTISFGLEDFILDKINTCIEQFI